MSKKKQNLPALTKKTSAALVDRMTQLTEGEVTIEDLEIVSSGFWVRHRRADDPMPDHAILAQAILDNNPGSSFNDFEFKFLRNMLSSSHITSQQAYTVKKLGKKFLEVHSD